MSAERQIEMYFEALGGFFAFVLLGNYIHQVSLCILMIEMG